MVAKQIKEKNGRKRIRRMILVEARSLCMINAHLDNSQMLQCSYVIHLSGFKDTWKSIHEHSVKCLSGYKEYACCSQAFNMLNRQKFASLMSPGHGKQYLYMVSFGYWVEMIKSVKCEIKKSKRLHRLLQKVLNYWVMEL